MSPDRIRRVLKKRGFIGNEQELIIKQDPVTREIKQGDLEMLELEAAAGEIDLKYLDESCFCMWCSPGYTYYPIGEQKRLEHTTRRGRRLSIIGLFQPLVSFVYGLVIGSINSKSYIKMMENEAIQAEQELKANGRIRVIVPG